MKDKLRILAIGAPEITAGQKDNRGNFSFPVNQGIFQKPFYLNFHSTPDSGDLVSAEFTFPSFDVILINPEVDPMNQPLSTARAEGAVVLVPRNIADTDIV